MITYFLRRVNLLVFTLLILCLGSYWLAYLFPGDAIINLSGNQTPTPIERQILAETYATDTGLIWQFMRYLQLLWEGNWGLSFASGGELYQEILRILPASIELSAYALVLSFMLGIPLGFWAGLKHNKMADYSILSTSMVGYSVPVFWLALILILVFSLQLDWFPISGRVSLLYDIPQDTGFILVDILRSDLVNKDDALRNALNHLVLPTLSISVVTSTIIMRITRNSVIEVMESDYIKAAYAKGLSSFQVVLRHGVRNALLPILPQLAMQFTTLLTNAMIVESIFSWPGIGNWLIQAIDQQDFPAIRVGMLAVASLVVIITVFIDICSRMIDPKQIKGRRVKI